MQPDRSCTLFAPRCLLNGSVLADNPDKYFRINLRNSETLKCDVQFSFENVTCVPRMTSRRLEQVAVSSPGQIFRYGCPKPGGNADRTETGFGLWIVFSVAPNGLADFNRTLLGIKIARSQRDHFSGPHSCFNGKPEENLIRALCVGQDSFHFLY